MSCFITLQYMILLLHMRRRVSPIAAIYILLLLAIYTFSCKLKVQFSSSEVCKLGRRYNFYIIPLLCLSIARPYHFILSHSYVHGVMHVCAAIVSSLLMLILDPLHLLHESSILFMFHFLLHYLHFLLSTRGFHCNSRGEYLSNIFPRSFTSPGYSWPSPMS